MFRKKGFGFLSALIVLLSFLVSAFFYPLLPETMASHWNYIGKVDGYLPKFWGAYLMPLILVFLLALFKVIPVIDPLKKNIKEFYSYYEKFVFVLFLFLFYIHLLVILWNLEIEFNFSLALPPAVGILFYYIGILLENSKKNWFIGVRTPWTLSNSVVWEKTNQLGGKLFKVAGLTAFLGLLFPDYSINFVLVPVILIAIFLVIYSYYKYQKVIEK